MKASTPPCTAGCGRPSPVALCGDCTDKLRRDLDDVVNGLLDELETSYLRQSRTGPSGGSPSAETPLPWDDRASEQSTAISRGTVTRWARVVLEHANPDFRSYVELAEHDRRAAIAASRHRRATRIAHTLYLHRDAMLPASLPARARAILEHLDWLRAQPFAGEAYQELHRAVGRVLHVVDRPADAAFIGLCPGGWPDEEACATPLYSRPKTKQHQCPECSRLWLTDQLRPYFEQLANEHLGTAAEIARAVTLMGDHVVTPERIRKWKQRGRLLVRGHLRHQLDDGRILEQPLYRVGDVIDRLSEDAAAANRREAKKEAQVG